jgi:hypothetical protein
MMDDAESTVRALLSAAGLMPSDDEFATIIAAYERHKAGIDSLYDVPDARYETPALIFNPTPVFDDWSR